MSTRDAVVMEASAVRMDASKEKIEASERKFVDDFVCVGIHSFLL